MNVGARLEEIRSGLRLTQAEMAAQMGLPLRTYTRYATGERAPSAEALQALVRMGIDLNWLIEGIGRMHIGESLLAPTSSSAVRDADLVGRVLEEISAVYKEFGWGRTLHQLGAEAAQIADDIAADNLAPEARMGAVRGAAAMLRRQLRQAIANPNSDASGKSQG
jgi:transcriptional regulator with XRE-family HTH domain